MKNKSEIERELLDMCKQILALLENHLIKNAGGPEAQVFYKKMKGDYFRYIAEFAKAGEKEEAMGQANASYQDAFNVAKDHLDPTHPIRLGLALNFSVFYYEIETKTDKACDMAK